MTGLLKNTKNNKYCYSFCLVSKLLVPTKYFLYRIISFEEKNKKNGVYAYLYITHNNYLISVYFSFNKEILIDLKKRIAKDSDHLIYIISNDLEITFLPNLTDKSHLDLEVLHEEDILNKIAELAILSLEKNKDILELKKARNSEEVDKVLEKINYLNDKVGELYKKVFLGNGNSITSTVSFLKSNTLELKNDLNKLENLLTSKEIRLEKDIELHNLKLENLIKEIKEKLEEELDNKLNKDDYTLLYLIQKTDIKTLFYYFLILIVALSIGVTYITPIVEDFLIESYNKIID